MDTKELLRKAAMVLSDIASAGTLNPDQANAFIDMLQEATTLTAEARVEKMSAPKQNFNKLGFNSRIMYPAGEAADPGAGAESKPAASQVQLSTVEGIAIVKVGYSVFEDNVERAALADHIVRLIAERAGVDLEERYINGDSASGDAWLALDDGVMKLATSHVADMAGASTDVIASCDAAYKTLPKKYLRNKREWRFYTTPDMEFQMRQALSERATAAGDNFLLTDTPVLLRGIPVVSLPLLADKVDVDSVTAGNQPGADILLVHPKNVVIGVQRSISIENQRLIRERTVEYVATIRSDVEFEEEDAVAKAINVKYA